MPYENMEKFIKKGTLDGFIPAALINKKEICKCCRKDLGLLSGNIAILRGKCQHCNQKVCSACVIQNVCHKCKVKMCVSLDPHDLMRLTGKQLIDISSKLHFHNPKGYEKSELVTVILAVYGVKWERPIPEQPSSNDTVAVNSTCVVARSCSLENDVALVDRVALDPDGLMQLSRKELLELLEHNGVSRSDITAHEKGDLVKVVLDLLGTHDDWRPPPPPPEGANDAGVSSPPVIHVGAQCNEAPRPAPSSTRDLRDEDESSDDRVSLKDIATAEAIHQHLRIPQLKHILEERGVNLEGVCEKNDLADQVTALWMAEHQKQDGIAVTTTTTLSETEQSTSTNQRESRSQRGNENGETSSSSSAGYPTPLAPKVNSNSPSILLSSEVPSLRDLASQEEVQMLSVRQLKSVLQKHSVDYSGCRERQELVDRAVELWKDRKKWDEVVEKEGDIPFPDLCKICMDAPMDCVLLECGHIVSCTECGRQLSECPICRHFVVRVVHTFKV